jgi:phage protein U
MAIGYFGDVVFSTSDKRVLSFRDFKVTASGNWGEHKRIRKKSEWEFMGPDAIGVSFTITLDSSFGVNPREQIDLLNTYAEDGTVFPLVIGDRKVGNRFRATNISSSWNHVLSGGELLKASVNVSFEEYE